MWSKENNVKIQWSFFLDISHDCIIFKILRMKNKNFKVHGSWNIF